MWGPSTKEWAGWPGSCSVSAQLHSLPWALPLASVYFDRFPFYFELKIAFVIWLLSPYTKGSSVLYRKFVHPTLSNKEKVCPHSELASQPAPGPGSPVPRPRTFLALPGGAQAWPDLARPSPLGQAVPPCRCKQVGQGLLLTLLPSLQPLRRSTSTSHRPETRATRP